jgi:heme a synthase
MLVLFALGGLQGAVGWWMVQSGLETRVSVSQYRLAIHLGVAVVLLGAVLWTAMEYLRPVARAGAGQKLAALAWGLVAIVYVQMLLGAIVAGLHAGLIHNTWPSMNGRLLPEDAFAARPWWTNFLDNPGLAQFDHRMVAYGVAVAAVALWIAVRRAGVQGRAWMTSNTLVAIVLLQIVLGIATLLNQAPLALAALHQATAVTVFAAALWNAYEISGAAGAAIVPG